MADSVLFKHPAVISAGSGFANVRIHPPLRDGPPLWAHWRNYANPLDSPSGVVRASGVPMRIAGAVLVVLLAALPAAAQNDNPQPGAASGKSAAQGHKFRKSATRHAVLRARAAARRAAIAAQHSDPAAAAGEGTVRMAAAAARRRPPAPPAPSGPTRDQSGLPLADRIAIQFDLAWVGEYNGLINGEFNDKTIAAIKTYQRNRKFKETGVLNTQERALLAASAKAKQAQVGWTMVDDDVTGARLGMPSKQVPVKTPGKTGTRWASAQGQVQVETFKV